MFRLPLEVWKHGQRMRAASEWRERVRTVAYGGEHLVVGGDFLRRVKVGAGARAGY